MHFCFSDTFICWALPAIPDSEWHLFIFIYYSGLALNAVRCSENAKSVRKCVRFGLACVRLHGSVGFVFMFVFGVCVHVRGPILRKSTNSTLGKRASFSHNSQKWHPFSENVCFSWTFSEFVCFSWKFSEFCGKSTNSTHGKRASFSQNSRKWHPFSENVRFS